MRARGHYGVMARCIMKTESIKKLNFIYQRSEDEIIKQTVLEILRIEENRVSGKFDYYKYVSKEPFREVLMGVYHKNGFKVATNAHILVAIKDEYDVSELEGRVLKKDGELLKEEDGYKYPNWESVIPDLSNKRCPKVSEVVKIDFDKWKEIYAHYKADKKIGAEKGGVKVGKAYYGIELFNLLIAALKRIGKDEFINVWNIDGKVEYPAAGFMKADDGSVVLLMPKRCDGEYYEL